MEGSGRPYVRKQVIQRLMTMEIRLNLRLSHPTLQPTDTRYFVAWRLKAKC